MFFRRIEDLRVDADKTQEDVAKVLGCQREVYRRYEKGIHEIPVWALIRLSQYYNKSTDYILGLSDDPRPPRGPSRKKALDKRPPGGYNSE